MSLLLLLGPTEHPLEGTAALALSATADLTILPAMAGSADLTLTATGDLTVPKPLDGTATLTLTTAGALTVPKPLAAAITLEVSTVANLDGLDVFTDTVTISVPLGAGSLFNFRDQVHIVQGALIDFRDTVAIARALQNFSDRLRILPDVRTLFDEDVQRPVGRVEVA